MTMTTTSNLLSNITPEKYHTLIARERPMLYNELCHEAVYKHRTLEQILMAYGYWSILVDIIKSSTGITINLSSNDNLSPIKYNAIQNVIAAI